MVAPHHDETGVHVDDSERVAHLIIKDSYNDIQYIERPSSTGLNLANGGEQ